MTALVCCAVTHTQTSVAQAVVSSTLGRSVTYISVCKSKIPLLRA